jgi:integrase
MKLSEIHPFLIEKHKQARIADGHRVAINRELTALKVLFNRCRDWKKYEGENPVRSVKQIDEPLNRLRFLSNEEALLGQCGETLRAIVLLGIYAGFRINAEALTLKVENVDINRKQITIEAVYSKNREAQTIPLHSKLVAPLENLIRKSRTGLMFETSEGRQIRSVRTAFTNACQHANLTDVTPHTLRHTFASRLGMAGINNLTLQKLGRWKEPRMILHYAHLSQEHLARH